MDDDHIHYDVDTNMSSLAWQPVSIAAAKPYLKAIGLITTLIIVWAGLCTI